MKASDMYGLTEASVKMSYAAFRRGAQIWRVLSISDSSTSIPE